VLNDLRRRGVQDVLVSCVDGLKGFPAAIEATFPHARVQPCIVHLIRASLRYVNYRGPQEGRLGATPDLQRAQRRPGARRARAL
jgi:putative transposase